MATVPTLRAARQRKPLSPSTGTCRWLRKPVWPCELIPAGVAGLLEIGNDRTRASYGVLPVAGGGESGGGFHYRLTKAGPANDVYDIDTSNPACWECTCADFVFNRDRAGTPDLRECKHCRALRNALTKLFTPS